MTRNRSAGRACRRPDIYVTVVLAWCWLCGSAVPSARAAFWITPSFPPGQERAYEPVPLYWFDVKESPFAYRSLIQVKEDLKYAVTEARSSGYLYVFVDAHPVFQFHPPEGEDSQPDRAFEIDLTPYLPQGSHVLVVSAPRAGFALDGVAQYESGTERLQTDEHWQVMISPPPSSTAVVVAREVAAEVSPASAWPLESWPSKRTSALHPAAVAIGKPFVSTADFPALAAQALAARTVSQSNDTLWRLGLLAHKGIVIHEGSAHGWGRAANADPTIISEAGGLYRRLLSLSTRVDGLLGNQDSPPPDEVSALAHQVQLAASATEVLSLKQLLLDELKALTLAAPLIDASATAPLPTRRELLRQTDLGELRRLGERLSARRAALRRAWGHPLNLLNESRYDRLGWLPDPDLVDSQLGAWGLRVNPVTGPAMIKADGDWRFATDPTDTGETEKRQTVGYNIENQWPKITVPKAWDSDSRFRGIEGRLGIALGSTSLVNGKATRSPSASQSTTATRLDQRSPGGLRHQARRSKLRNRCRDHAGRGQRARVQSHRPRRSPRHRRKRPPRLPRSRSAEAR